MGAEGCGSFGWHPTARRPGRRFLSTYLPATSDPYGHAFANAHSANGYAHVHADANAHTDDHPIANTAVVNTRSHVHTYQYAYADADSHTCTHIYGDGDAYILPVGPGVRNLL